MIEQAMETLVTIRHKFTTGIPFVGFFTGFFVGIVVVFFAYGWYGAPGSIYIIILTGVLAGFITTMAVVNIRDLNVPLLFQVTDMFFVLVGIAFIFVIPLMAIITRRKPYKG